MQIVTVGSKYQIVIPKEARRKINGLKPGSQAVVKNQGKDTLIVRLKPVGWAKTTRGLMNNWWKTDPLKELEKIRSGWK